MQAASAVRWLLENMGSRSPQVTISWLPVVCERRPAPNFDRGDDRIQGWLTVHMLPGLLQSAAYQLANTVYIQNATGMLTSRLPTGHGKLPALPHITIFQPVDAVCLLRLPVCSRSRLPPSRMRFTTATNHSRPLQSLPARLKILVLHA